MSSEPNKRRLSSLRNGLRPADQTEQRDSSLTGLLKRVFKPHSDRTAAAGDDTTPISVLPKIPASTTAQHPATQDTPSSKAVPMDDIAPSPLNSGQFEELLGVDMTRFTCTDAEYIQGLSNTKGQITPDSIKSAITRAGILMQDPRISGVCNALKDLPPKTILSKEELFKVTNSNMLLMHRIATQELTIANFSDFSAHLDIAYKAVYPNKEGNNADYIPILKNADSEKFGVAFCSVDGQFHSIGDANDEFSIQSTSKPMTFALALNRMNGREVLKWCGIEPSGRPFNDLTLLPDNRPFNPMVNAGALMTAGVLASSYPELAARDKPVGEKKLYADELWEKIMKPLWTDLTGNGVVGEVGFSETTFMSERDTADNNLGIAHILKDRKGLPEPVKLQSMVDFYLRACSTVANTSMMAVAAATLANGGKNPFTGKQVLRADTVKKTLSVLSFCGFYDNAGEFFFDTGVPSKSGVSGVVFLVLPNVGGLAIFSPRLDAYGNSVRGASFSKRLVDIFTFHSFDNLSSNATGCKLDPRFSCDFGRHRLLSRTRWGVSAGDERALKVDDLLVEVCVRVAMIDGSVDEDEIHELKMVYSAIMAHDLPSERVEKVMKKIGSKTSGQALDDLYELVCREEPQMIDVEKELVLEAAFRVSTADGVVEEEEKALLLRLARALHVPDIVLEAKLLGWTPGIEGQGAVPLPEKKGN